MCTFCLTRVPLLQVLPPRALTTLPLIAGHVCSMSRALALGRLFCPGLQLVRQESSAPQHIGLGAPRNLPGGKSILPSHTGPPGKSSSRHRKGVLHGTTVLLKYRRENHCDSYRNRDLPELSVLAACGFPRARVQTGQFQALQSKSLSPYGLHL